MRQQNIVQFVPETVCGMLDFGLIDIFCDCNEAPLTDRVPIRFIAGVFLENAGYNLLNPFIPFTLSPGSEDLGGVASACKWSDDL